MLSSTSLSSYSEDCSTFSFHLPFLHQANSSWLRLNSGINILSPKAILTNFCAFLSNLGLSFSQPNGAVLSYSMFFSPLDSLKEKTMSYFISSGTSLRFDTWLINFGWMRACLLMDTRYQVAVSWVSCSLFTANKKAYSMDIAVDMLVLIKILMLLISDSVAKQVKTPALELHRTGFEFWFISSSVTLGKLLNFFWNLSFLICKIVIITFYGCC